MPDGASEFPTGYRGEASCLFQVLTQKNHRSRLTAIFIAPEHFIFSSYVRIKTWFLSLPSNVSKDTRSRTMCVDTTAFDAIGALGTPRVITSVQRRLYLIVTLALALRDALRGVLGIIVRIGESRSET